MYISYFNYVLGENNSIDKISALANDENALRFFKENGFENFLKFEDPISSVLDQLIKKTIQDTEVAPSSIDAVLFVSDNAFEEKCKMNAYTNYNALRNTLYALLAQYGINKSLPYLVGGSGCANLTSATAIAEGLLNSGKCKKLLVLFVDKLSEVSRILPALKDQSENLGTIGSDFAAGFVISKEPCSGPVLKIESQFSHAQLNILNKLYSISETGNSYEYKLEVVKGLMSFRKLSKTLGKNLSEYKEVYIGNYTKIYFDLYAKQFGWKDEQLKEEGKAEYAHIQSMDGLYAIFNSSTKKEKELIFLFGPCMWSAIEFSYFPNGIKTK